MKTFLSLVFTFCLTSCLTQKEEINLIPMYGHLPKKQQYLDADKKFLAFCDSKFKTRKEAADSFAYYGWYYYERGDLNTAMKRFNQVWLLDSTNCQAFWGFGNIQGIKGKSKESNDYLKESIKLGCKSPYIYEGITSNNFDLFENLKDSQLLNDAKVCIEASIELDSKNARVLNQKAVYFYYTQSFDSAMIYANKARILDTSAVSNDFFNILKTKTK